MLVCKSSNRKSYCNGSQIYYIFITHILLCFYYQFKVNFAVFIVLLSTALTLLPTKAVLVQ